LYIKGKEDEIGNPLKLVYENAGQRWEVAVTMSDTGFKQVSFVNSIATTKVNSNKLNYIYIYFNCVIYGMKLFYRVVDMLITLLI